MRIERVCKSETDTRLIGETIGRLARAGDVYLLDGPLGAGKTTLTRAIASGMGCDVGLVSSPTFVVVKEYANASGPDLAHVDAYRLSGPDDLESLGWDRVSERRDLVIAVEWARRIEDEFASREDVARITLDPEDALTRVVGMEFPDAWAEREGVGALRDQPPVRCPTTGAPVPPDAPYWPFVDERAQYADLHKWMEGEYKVSREASSSEELSD